MLTRRSAIGLIGCAALSLAGGKRGATSARAPADGNSLHDLTVTDALAAFRSGWLSPLEYTEALLERQNAWSALNAWIYRNDEALRRAAAESGALLRERYPLAGLPFAIKDNIDVKGQVTSAGTPALSCYRPPATAPVVAALMSRGALTAGKLGLHELAAGGTGANLRYGQVRNPYDFGVVPGGSSSGSAAAVAARLVPAALGTDTGGSCRLPAALCGCIGFRPSTGRYDGRGVVPRNARQDTIGWLTRSAADVELLDAFSGRPAAPARSVSLRNLRLGVPRPYFYEDLHPDVEAVMDDTLARFAEAGIHLVETELPRLATLRRRTSSGGWASLLRDLDDYLLANEAGITAAELAASVADPKLRAAMLTALPDYRAGEPGDEQELAAAEREMQAVYEACFSAARLDALVIPASPIPAPPLPEDPAAGGQGSIMMIRNTGPAAVAGLPGLSLPAGLTRKGLPVAVEVDAPRQADATLFRIARLLESIIPPLPPPALPPRQARREGAAASPGTGADRRSQACYSS